MKRTGKVITGRLGELQLGDRFPVRVMGVINLSHDSFYKGSVMNRKEGILHTALQMQDEGADVIDLGARSTAPYRTMEVSEELESNLLSKALKILVDKIRIPLSVDSARLKPAKVAMELGAKILNDPFGLAHEQGAALAELTSDFKCSLVITAHEPTPRQFPSPIYRVIAAIRSSLDLAKTRGVKLSKITIDPGIGFFSDKKISNVEWNSIILGKLEALRIFGLPILVGVSRKKFLGILGGNIPAEDRLPGSLSAAAIAVYNGAHIIRTHDVGETKQAVKVASTIRLATQKGLSQLKKVSQL